MATRGRGGGGKEREKKGNPSSSPQPKKPTPSKPSSSTPSSSSSSSSQKPPPNYLKPTISSSIDSSLRAARRTTTNSSSSSTTTTTRSLQKPLNVPATAKQPSFARRHDSVDKPTSTATRQTKNQPSSIPTQRSLSTISAASVKAAAGSAMRRSASVKASTSTSTSSIDTRKMEKKKGVKSVAVESSAEIQPQDADPLHHMVAGGDREDVESLADISEMVDQDEQLGDPALVVEVESAPKECHVKDDPDMVAQPETDSEQKECQVMDEKIVEEEKEGETEEQDKQVIEAPVPEKEEQLVVTEGERGSLEDQSTVKIEEKNVVVETEVEVSEQGDDSGRREGQSGKEVQQPYNDVIEETASKLMEDKRNKVRALAGAFETVISLQDTKPESSK